MVFLSPIICFRREGVRTRMESHPSLRLSAAECCLSCWKPVPEEGAGSERGSSRDRVGWGRWMRPRLRPRRRLRRWMFGGQELKSPESPRRWRLPMEVSGADLAHLQADDPWVGKIPWRAQQPTPVFLPGESHGQRSLAGYSP